MRQVSFTLLCLHPGCTHRSCESPFRTHRFCESLALTHRFGGITWMYASIFSSPARTTQFCESPGCTHRFCESAARTDRFCESLGCTHHFCASPRCTHCVADLSCVIASTQASSSGLCRQQGIQRVTQHSDSHSSFFFSCWNVRHRLRLCVLENLYVLLVHKG